jgi:hypothetical protein
MGWISITFIKVAIETAVGLMQDLLYCFGLTTSQPINAITCYPDTGITAFAQTITISSHATILAPNISSLSQTV